jgi:hypothetical protein
MGAPRMSDVDMTFIPNSECYLYSRYRPAVAASVARIATGGNSGDTGSICAPNLNGRLTCQQPRGGIEDVGKTEPAIPNFVYLRRVISLAAKMRECYFAWLVFIYKLPCTCKLPEF